MKKILFTGKAGDRSFSFFRLLAILALGLFFCGACEGDLAGLRNKPLSNFAFDSEEPAAEAAIQGARAGSFSAEGGGGTLVYRLVPGEGSTDNGLFTVRGADLKITAESLARGNYKFRASVEDENGESTEGTFTLTVSANPDDPSNDPDDPDDPSNDPDDPNDPSNDPDDPNDPSNNSDDPDDPSNDPDDSDDPSGDPGDSPGVPARPTGLKSSPGMKCMYLSWSPTVRAESYEVYYSTGDSFDNAEKFVEEPTEPTVKVTGLEDSTVYKFWVKAKNQAGTGKESRIFTSPKKTSDPVQPQFVYRGAAGTKFVATNGPGDYYLFIDLGPDEAPDERYKFGYMGLSYPPGTIKYVDTKVGIIIYQEERTGKFVGTYCGVRTTWPYEGVFGQANNSKKLTSVPPESDTLEEAINKLAHAGGPGQVGGRWYYYNETINITYRIEGNP